MYKLRFAPLTITPEKMSEIFEKVAGWTQLPLPGGPVSMEVRAGETVALDTIKGGERQRIKVTGPANDFTPKTRPFTSAHLT